MMCKVFFGTDMGSLSSYVGSFSPALFGDPEMAYLLLGTPTMAWVSLSHFGDPKMAGAIVSAAFWTLR